MLSLHIARFVFRCHYTVYSISTMDPSLDQILLCYKSDQHQSIRADDIPRDPHECQSYHELTRRPRPHNTAPRLCQQREDWILLNELENLQSNGNYICQHLNTASKISVRCQA